MQKALEQDCKIIKAFNNNIVLVEAEGREKLLFEKGIGFGKRPGDQIRKGTEIEKIFVIEDKDNLRNFRELTNNVDNEFIGFCEELIFYISKELGEELSENIHIALTDHLSFAIKRLKNNEEIQNPFVAEVETLYKKEFSLAQDIADRIQEKMGVYIPDGEVGFIALHIHSARKNGKLSNTIKYSFISNTIIEYVEDALEVEIDRKSLDYARFLTHLRFAIERITTNSPIANDLIQEIKKKYRKSYKIAQNVAVILEDNLEDVKVVEDEVAYLAMHIERFRVSLKKVKI
ncbi:glucose PTS transporter transcription antiterminator GlcT [Clostridium sp. YIM B02551]|uniref:glucose PTS transporter transcription antiterminator GlcT n=1 Tax=Clostridium sp. YIM B02551 TaxID=2910679 RepID=UPI001EEBE1F2|nr:PRD domain-containing protein [Clostridium sp. YIM B02551]